jgi:hypothetical protein
LLQELYVPVGKATVIFCDNISAVYLSQNPVYHRERSMLNWTYTLSEKG